MEKNVEKRVEELAVELKNQFFPSSMYGPHILGRAEKLAEEALKAGMNLCAGEQ